MSSLVLRKPYVNFQLNFFFEPDGVVLMIKLRDDLLKFEFERRPHIISNFSLNISSSHVRIKLHTKNQPLILFNFGDSYEKDLKIRIWKTTSKNSNFFSIFVLVRLKTS